LQQVLLAPQQQQQQQQQALMQRLQQGVRLQRQQCPIGLLLLDPCSRCPALQLLLLLLLQQQAASRMISSSTPALHMVVTP
jgi:hypothetical protein